MTVNEAIPILFDYHKGYPSVGEDDFLDAIKLGLEALERIKKSRKDVRLELIWFLPGETAET